MTAPWFQTGPLIPLYSCRSPGRSRASRKRPASVFACKYGFLSQNQKDARSRSCSVVRYIPAFFSQRELVDRRAFCRSESRKLPLGQSDRRKEAGNSSRKGAQFGSFLAPHGTSCVIDCLHTELVGHIAHKIIRRQSLVIEKRRIHEEHGWHTIFAAKRRSQLRYGCIGVVEGREHCAGR